MRSSRCPHTWREPASKTNPQASNCAPKGALSFWAYVFLRKSGLRSGNSRYTGSRISRIKLGETSGDRQSRALPGRVSLRLPCVLQEETEPLDDLVDERAGLLSRLPIHTTSPALPARERRVGAARP